MARRSKTTAPVVRVPRGETLARLSIERLGRRWAVVEGADKTELKRAPGHLIDTALPGARGNCVIAGHRDTQFRVLRNVEIGYFDRSRWTQIRVPRHRAPDRRAHGRTRSRSDLYADTYAGDLLSVPLCRSRSQTLR